MTTLFPIKNMNWKKSRFHGGFLLSSCEKVTQSVKFIINAGWWGEFLHVFSCVFFTCQLEIILYQLIIIKIHNRHFNLTCIYWYEEITWYYVSFWIDLTHRQRLRRNYRDQHISTQKTFKNINLIFNVFLFGRFLIRYPISLYWVGLEEFLR